MPWLNFQSLGKMDICHYTWPNHFKTLVTKPKSNGTHFLFILYGLLEVLGQAQLQAHNKYALKHVEA